MTLLRFETECETWYILEGESKVWDYAYMQERVREERDWGTEVVRSPFI